MFFSEKTSFSTRQTSPHCSLCAATHYSLYSELNTTFLHFSNWSLTTKCLMLHCMMITLHYTKCSLAICIALGTVHCTLYPGTLSCVQHTLHWSLCNEVYCIFAFYIVYCTVYNVPCALYIENWALHWSLE